VCYEREDVFPGWSARYRSRSIEMVHEAVQAVKTVDLAEPSRPDPSWTIKEVNVAGMKIMLAVIEGVVPLPGTGIGMGGLSDVRPAVLAMGLGVDLEQLDIIRLGDHFLLIVLEKVCQGLEGLRGGVGPGVAAPPAAGLRD